MEFESKVTKISALVDKLQHLSVYIWLQCPTHLSLALQNLDNAINEAFADLGHAQDFNHVLPKQKKVAPNQHSWTETAEVMGARVKTKKPSKHTDPYSGKETSGKKAKPDARQPLKRHRVGERYLNQNYNSNQLKISIHQWKRRV